MTLTGDNYMAGGHCFCRFKPRTGTITLGFTKDICHRTSEGLFELTQADRQTVCLSMLVCLTVLDFGILQKTNARLILKKITRLTGDPADADFSIKSDLQNRPILTILSTRQD